jgi:hypothetical protein
MMSTVTAREVRYAALKKTTSHWCLIPPMAKAAPVTMRTTPAMPNAGVIVGWIGNCASWSDAVPLRCPVEVGFECDVVRVDDVVSAAVFDCPLSVLSFDFVGFGVPLVCVLDVGELVPDTADFPVDAGVVLGDSCLR